VETSVIDQKRAQLSDVLTQIDALATRDDFNADDVAELKTRASQLQTQIQTLTESMTARAASADLDAVLTRAARVQDQKVREQAAAGSTPGEIFTRSAAFTSYAGHGRSGMVDLPIHTRAITLPIKTADFHAYTMAGAQLLPVAGLQTPLLDLIPTIATSLAAFPIWGVEVAEGAADVVAEGSVKPSLDLTEERINVALDLVAVWTQATRQALEDIPMMRSLIDQELVRAVLRKFETLAQTAVTGATLPTATAPADGGGLQGAIRHGIAAVQVAGWTPNAVAINPADAADIDISALSLPQTAGNNFWGLRVVPVAGLTAGTAIVGDFSNGAVTFERSAGVSVFITDSHADTFTSNIFTMLAETRRKTVIRRADAFAKVSVAAAP
jgi:HK97 family phage major capsid protein